MILKRRMRTLSLPSAPLAVLTRLHHAGFRAFAVGGAVRDAVLGQTPKDVDLATSATPSELAELFPHSHPVGARFGVMLVVEANTPIQVATFRRESGYRDGRHPEQVEFADLEADAARRDFTINGLYFDPQRNEIIDPVGGLEDLEKRVLRTIGEPSLRFQEDHLRLLRAARFAAQLDFTVESECWWAIHENAAKLERISAERVRAELESMLMGPRPARALRILHYCGILAVVLPEVEATIGVQQPAKFHPEGDVFVHTCMALEALESRTLVLAWGALLHDVGKPLTYSEGERIRFDRHVPVGMEVAERILRRLRCDRDTIERVVALVREHLRFAAVKKMRPSTLKRFLRQENFADHLALHRADCLSSHGDLSLYDFCLQQLQHLNEEGLRPPSLLSGRDLIAMGFSAGPLLGVILRAVEDQQLEGRMRSIDDAREFVLRRWRPGSVD